LLRLYTSIGFFASQNDYSFGIQTMSEAQNIGVTYGYMLNRAGQVCVHPMLCGVVGLHIYFSIFLSATLDHQTRDL